jgi:glycosyltransferase involved in cell wall biosynthesis
MANQTSDARQMALPRVLLVNQQSIQRANATGITLRSFFSAWPEERAMELFLDGKAQNGAGGEQAMPALIPTRNVIRSLTNGCFGKRINASMKRQSDASAEKPARQSIRSLLRQACVLAVDACPVALSRVEWRALDEYRPQVIYTLGASVSALRLACRVAARYDAPIVLHTMDHWVEHLQWEQNPLIRPYRRRLDRWLRRCLRRTRHILTVSEAMADDYRLRFHKPCSALMNAVDLDACFCPPKEPDGTIRLVYAGGFQLNRWRALAELGRVLAKMPGSPQLEIYTDADANQYRDAFAGLPIVVSDAVPHAEIARVYRRADLLVHCECDDPLLKGFYRYSISTKIPEYLASGRPMLYYGPKDTGVYRYLFAERAAFLAEDTASLNEAVFAALDETNRRPVIDAALALARKNHSRQGAQALLERVLCSAANEREQGEER